MSNITATLPILTALNNTYQKIRESHPELPDAVIVVGAPGRTRGGQIHGHFQADSWVNPEFTGFEEGEDDRDTLPEISLSGESLERGGKHILGTLLHEAAHALAHERGIKDTSNAGRYHNKRFRAIGYELGILLEQAGTIGWSDTRISSVTYIRYFQDILALDMATYSYRLPDYSRTVKPRTRTKGLIDCECGDEVTVSLQWFERHQASLICEDCMEHFHIVESEEN